MDFDREYELENAGLDPEDYETLPFFSSVRFFLCLQRSLRSAGAAAAAAIRLQGLAIGDILCSSQSRMRPSRETVTTCQGMNLPLLRRAFSAARCSPPQQGTSMRRTVRLFTSFSRRMAVSFSV